MRLSPSGRESRPYPLKDSDVIQLGVDYQNRPEDIYKAIVMRVLVQHPDGTKKQVNPVKWVLKTSLNVFDGRSTFSLALCRLHAALKSLIAAASPLTNRNADDPSSSVDCAICLNCIAPFQALFLAPCSHCFHFKCIKPLLETQGVMFLCPMCRQVANLEASVSSENLLDGFDEAGSTTQESDTESGQNEQTLGRASMAEALAAANAAASPEPSPPRANHRLVASDAGSNSNLDDGMDVDDGAGAASSGPSAAAGSMSPNAQPAPGNITINLHLNGVSAQNLLAETGQSGSSSALAGPAAASPSPVTPQDAQNISVPAEVKRSVPGSPAGASGAGASNNFTFRFSIERNGEQ